jgi:hypothetical protein
MMNSDLDDFFTWSEDGNGTCAEGFACLCSEQGTVQSQALLKQAYDLLGKNVTPGNFLTLAVHSLQWDYRVSINGIITDQWFMITASEPEVFLIMVQCDEMEHGIAGVLVACAQRKQRLKGTDVRD